MVVETLEEWLKESFYKTDFTEEQFKELVAILEPVRKDVEEFLKTFNPDEDKWKSFRIMVWKALPEVIDNRIYGTIRTWWKKGELDLGDRKDF